MLVLQSMSSDGADGVGSDKLAVGRLEDNDLCLENERISALHALFQWRGGAWFVRDLDSRNGTFVFDKPAKGWLRVKPGDKVRFGKDIVYRVAAARAPGARAIAPTAGTEEGELRLELVPEREEGGVARFHTPGRTVELQLGTRFDLLFALAAQRVGDRAIPDGGWIEDADLRSAIWGRTAEEMSRSALPKLVHDLREDLRRQDLPTTLIRKARGRTRLELDADLIAGID